VTEDSRSTTAACSRFMPSKAAALPDSAATAILPNSSVTWRSTDSCVVPRATAICA